MKNLQNKDKSIIYIYNHIHNLFMGNFYISDIWDGDNFALGLQKGNKLIYISTWDQKSNTQYSGYYSEFELLNEDGSTKEVERALDNVSREELIKNIKEFFK